MQNKQVLKNNLFLAVTFLAVLLSSCQKTSCYHHSEALPKDGWERNRTLFFHDSIRNNQPEVIHYEIEIRHTNLYPYQNLWLYIRTKTSEGTNRLDSINWTLSEPSGRWLGSGWGSLYSLNHQLPDLTIHRSKRNRWFSIEIQHGLKDQTLPGIENVGVHLYSE